MCVLVLGLQVVQQDMPLVVMCFMIMIAVLCALFYRSDPYENMVLLGAIGNLSVILSIVAGFGLAMYMGEPFTVVAQSLPFIIVAIGVDGASHPLNPKP